MTGFARRALMILALGFFATFALPLKAQDSVSRATLELFKGAETNNLAMAKRAIYAGGDVLARNSLGQRAYDVAVDLNYMNLAHYIMSMRPKVKKCYVPEVTAQPVPVKVKKLPPPIKPLATARPKAVFKPRPVKPAGPVVAAISKSRSLEISKKTEALKPRPVVAKAIKKPVQRKTVVKSVPKPVPAKPVVKKLAVKKQVVKKQIVKVASVAPASPPAKPQKARAKPATSKSKGAFNFFGNLIRPERNKNTLCLEKSDGIRICIQALRWPKQIAGWFDVETVYYDGPQSLVMFENDQLRQIHVLFKRAGFDAVNKYLSTQLARAGQSGSLKTSEDTEAYLDRSNRIVVWQGLKGSWPDSLEIRELDSLRWSALPDEDHGAVRVFKSGEDPVFKHVSSADFMLGFLTSPNKAKK